MHHDTENCHPTFSPFRLSPGPRRPGRRIGLSGRLGTPPAHPLSPARLPKHGEGGDLPRAATGSLTCVFLFSAFTTEGYPSTSFSVIPTILEVCVVEKGSHMFSAITVRKKVGCVEMQ